MAADYDAAILGGGPAGVAAALGLARAGARVLLMERSPRPQDKPGEVIASSARPVLAGLGLERAFEPFRTHALAASLACWDSAEGTQRDAICDPYGGGVLVRRSQFEGWLLSAARAAGVDVRMAAEPREIERAGGVWRLALGTPDATLRAGLLIEATGRGRGAIGAGARRCADRQIALIARFPAGERGGDQRLLIEATEAGWFYAARPPSGEIVVSLQTGRDCAPKGAAARCAWWWAQMRSTRHISVWLRRFSPSAALRGHVAGGSIRLRLAGEGWVAVGDAAAAYDPLTGQGVATALAKGAALARLLASRSRAAAIAEYVDAERSLFENYETEHDAVYRRAAPRFSSAFWSDPTDQNASGPGKSATV